jgi:hypothetical protein
MKRQVYKIAAMAIAALIATSGYAQQGSSSASPSTPATPAAPTATANGSYSFAAPAQVYVTNSGNYAFETLGTVQDSAYRKKMQKLQDQMRDLQKEMSSLRTEEYKKASEERQKASAERFKSMDRKFSQTFSASGIGQQHYSYEKNNAELERKLASGEVKMKTKAYTKTYSIDGNDKLSIKNSFGKININVWNKNEIKVDVEIKAYADDDDKAKELLDQVNIKDSKGSDSVTFVTNIGDSDHSNNWTGTRTTNGKTSVRSTIVNYTVYMPAKNALSISNTFGAITLPEFGGKLNIKNTFGSFTAKALTNPDNVIKLTYCTADIESLTGSTLAVSFGSLNLDAADKLDANIQFSAAKIGKISNSGKIKLSYGDGLQIGDLANNLKTLNINASFAPVKLSSLANDNADFEVITGMGAGFTYNNNVYLNKNTDESSPYHYSLSKTYKGKIGKGNTDKVITIKSSYGSVKFDQ